MNPFITTYTGKKFFFNDITPEQIDIFDIAHALSMLCRFTGHIHQFYSVAQHSLLVDSRIVGEPQIHLAALLHDAAEAYVNDLAQPLKSWLVEKDLPYFHRNTSYVVLHNRILHAIHQKFGLNLSPATTEYVKAHDGIAAVYEAEAFLGLTPETMADHNFDLKSRKLWDPWDPTRFAEEQGDLPRQNVERDFLIRFHELKGQQNGK